MASDNGQIRLDWMDTLAKVLFHRPSFEHIWHAREQLRYPMHPAIREAVLIDAPADWHRLVLEWPHVSISDPARLAYTRSVEHGAVDRQTITSINKYIALNFPAIQSHTIRDICAKYGSHDFYISWEMDEMLQLLKDSPKTCMRWDHWKTGDWHPYQCYAPKFGWGLAVRRENGIPMARALVNKNKMCFVRSFGAIDNDRGHSQSDNALNSWLESIGYEYADGWDGLKLAKIDHPNGGWTAPYIDGDTQRVDDRNGYFLICHDGEYECTNTDGSIEDEDRSYCQCCDDSISLNRDDHHFAGRYEDILICDGCRDHHYVFAYGQNGNEYLINENNAICVGDNHYHDSYLNDNNIVFAVDLGEYEHQDNCVCLDDRSEWVSSDCTYAVYCEDSGTYEHIEDCVLLDGGDYILKTNNESELAA